MDANIGTVGGNGSNLAYANDGTAAVDFELTNYGNSTETKDNGQATSDNPKGNNIPQDLSARQDSGQQVQEDANPLPIGGINLLRQGFRMEGGERGFFAQGQTKPNAEETKKEQPAKNPGSGSKTSRLELGLKGDATILATNEPYNRWLTPPRNANAKAAIGYQASGEASGTFKLKPNVSITGFAGAGLGNYQHGTANDDSNFTFGLRGNVKLTPPKFAKPIDLTVELAGLRTFRTDDFDNRIYKSTDVSVSASYTFDVKLSNMTIKPSLTGRKRSTETPGFSRDLEMAKVDIRKQLSDPNYAFVASAGISRLHFTDGANAGRTDGVPFVNVGLEIDKNKTLKFGVEKRFSTQQGREYTAATASFTINLGRKFHP